MITRETLDACDYLTDKLCVPRALRIEPDAFHARRVVAMLRALGFWLKIYLDTGCPDCNARGDEPCDCNCKCPRPPYEDYVCDYCAGIPRPSKGRVVLFSHDCLRESACCVTARHELYPGIIQAAAAVLVDFNIDAAERHEVLREDARYLVTGDLWPAEDERAA